MIQLKVNNLKKIIDNKIILNNVDFCIESGKFTAILGPNGAGKSTLFRCIAGLAKIDQGEILIETKKEKMNVIYVFEKPVLYEHFTAEEHLKFVLDINEKKDVNVEKNINIFGIQDFKDKKIRDCSLGMKKRIQLMCAMVLEPSVLLLDEFVSGLDPISLRIVANILKEYTKNGNSVLLATHILSIAEEFCDSVIFIEDGNIIHKESNMHELKNRYKSLEEYYFKMVKEKIIE